MARALRRSTRNSAAPRPSGVVSLAVTDGAVVVVEGDFGVRVLGGVDIPIDG